MVRVFSVVAITTLLVRLIGLLIAFATVDPDTVGERTQYGNEIVDDGAFVRAGTMHTISYLGGIAGIITGGIAVFWERQRLSNPRPHQNLPPNAT